MAWELTGNSGTDPNVNFLGTIDNQPLVINTNSSEAMRINANGHVTVGPVTDTDLSTRFQVSEGHLGIRGTSDTFDQTLWLINNADKELRLTVGANAGGTAWYTQANTGTLGVDSGMDLRFSAGAAERMRIMGANGFVGIGTTTPNANLEVDSHYTAIIGAAGHEALATGVYGSGYIGIWGNSYNGGAVAVYGENSGGQGALGTRYYAGDFRGNVFILGTSDVAVQAESSDPSIAGTGVMGKGRGAGVTAFNSANSNAAYLASDCCAAWFTGEVYVGGKLTKSSGGFLIDHPLDPSNKYLSHSFVESSDMKNIYDGVVVMDASGEATVELPEWFDTVNTDFRYQLTCIGGYAQVYIAQEVQDNGFKIAGGAPGMKVSWQVTGIRKDAWASAHRIHVEEEKSVKERGNYLHPELYNASPEKSIERVRHGTPKPPRPAWNEGFPAGQQPRGLASGPQASGNGSNEDTVLKS